jgi:pyruvate/2-oxoacid:ferredoxin oxidoreductase alpha subunit/NAD-dependent dihydropyrimidine dehydrogenase PreA subunit
MPQVAERPKPFLFPEFCKGCGRCITVCQKHSIAFSDQIDPRTGLVPVVIDLETCNACGLCFDACPEPYGLVPRPADAADFELEDPEKLFGGRVSTAPVPVDIPDEHMSLPACEPLVVRGNYASAIGAILAGCRHFYGYPITPSTEGAELMAAFLPKLQGVFLQAVSEIATVNFMYGTAAAGKPSMTFTSSPGFSLMLEGISYMIGAELPGVFVNIMRGGPGLGNIAPEQTDIKLACRGLGHGNTHAIVLAPSTPQEMLDLTIRAFELTFKYRNPVIILGDGYLGQMTGRVRLPKAITKPGIPAWAVWGDELHRRNLISSIMLEEADLERHNLHLNRKYEAMRQEAAADLFLCDDAEVVVVACTTPARMAKGAVQELRGSGVKAGLFRPLTLWPFPIHQLQPLLPHVRRIVVVEASGGQLEDELRLALSHAGVHQYPAIESLRHFGGILPQQEEIVARVNAPATAGLQPQGREGVHA